MDARFLIRGAVRRTSALVRGTAKSLGMSLRGDAVGARDVPVVINSFNRLAPLRDLVAWLERAGVERIVILDNASTWPPLLEYYASTPHEVVRGENLGPRALWSTRRIWDRVKGGFYVYTDADVVPCEDCPPDAIEHLYALLRRRPLTPKAGLGLRIDDLPDHYARKAEVLAWEAQFWKRAIAPGVYRAAVDTTFALYRPYAYGWAGNALRTGPPYVARHTPWYENTAAPTEESRHYDATAKRGVSSWRDGQDAWRLTRRDRRTP